MPDTNDTANQPQGNGSNAGTAQPQVTGFENFLGDDVAEQLTADEPETSAEETEEAEVAEAETEESETEEQTEEEATSEPSMDEFLAGLTPEERAKYAKRYPTAWKLANDPNQPEDVRQLLRDKINTDFEYAKLRTAPKEEPTLEDETETEEETPQPLDPAKQREQYAAYIDNVVKAVVDPQVAAELGKQVFGAMGLDLSNPEDAEVKEYLNNAPKLGMTLAKGATDLVVTVLQNPQVLGPIVEAVFPGFGGMYESALYQRSWESVRSFKEKATGNQPYKDLPAFGTKEFQEALNAAADQIPDFDNLEFKDKNGRPLPLQQQAMKKYALLAKIASGQKVNPAVVQQAVETGKKIANRTEQRRQAGRALGAGQSNRNFADRNAGGDPVMDELDAEIASINSRQTPFASRK